VKLPRKLTIDGVTFRVRYHERRAAKPMPGGYPEAGKYHRKRREIVIWHGMPIELDRDTLLHELLHLLLDLADDCALTDAQEEMAVTLIAPWLLRVLRDNPKLVAFLTA
jgi:hypothetical protein